MSAATRGADSPWLFGALADLLLGCCGAYLVFIALIAQPGVRGALSPTLSVALPLLALLINTPHYGATLLRVYESRRERVHYALFSVWITALFVAWFVLGLHVVWLGSLLITVYLSWSTWHFAAQNYGVALMFLRRRGVPVTPGWKRLLYTSFVLSFVLTLLGMHGPMRAYGLAPVPQFEREVYSFLSLGIPAAFTDLAIPAVALACAVVIALVVLRAPRGVALRDLAPAALVLVVQASWFSIPAYLVGSGAYSGESLAVFGVWIPFFHSLQYLWICAYYARRSEAAIPLPHYWVKTVLAGAAAITLPGLLFAPGALGTLTSDAGLFILVFSAVNVHHFMLDGAIWKLRDGRVAQVLLRGRDAAERDARGPRPPLARVLHAAVWALAWLSLAISFYSIFELEFGVRRSLARGEIERVIAASDRLAWVGLESHAIHQNVALALALRQGSAAPDDPGWARVRHHFERSLELQPSAQAWGGLATLEYNAGELERARAAFDAALALDPGSLDNLVRRARVLLELGREQDSLRDLRRAALLAPDDAEIARAIARLEAGGGHQQGRP